MNKRDIITASIGISIGNLLVVVFIEKEYLGIIALLALIIGIIAHLKNK